LTFNLFAEEIKFSADSMSGVSGSKTDETKLTGNAFVKTSTMEIKADMISLNGEDFRYITAEGNVEGKNTETKMDFSCGKLYPPVQSLSSAAESRESKILSKKSQKSRKSS
jgi:hypothetical protein